MCVWVSENVKEKLKVKNFYERFYSRDWCKKAQFDQIWAIKKANNCRLCHNVYNLCTFTQNLIHVWGYILLHYLSISFSHLTAVGTPPPYSPSLVSGCGCSGCSGGLGPDEAEKGSTAVLSLWLPAPSPPPHIMNNGREKYIYLLIALAPWLGPFSLAQTAAAQGWGFWTPPAHATPPHPWLSLLLLKLGAS